MVSHLLSLCLSFCLSIFSFQDNNLSKYQWIFTKLGMCIDIVDIWTGIASMSKFHVIYLPHDTAGVYPFMFLFAGFFLCVFFCLQCVLIVNP